DGPDEPGLSGERSGVDEDAVCDGLGAGVDVDRGAEELGQQVIRGGHGDLSARGDAVPGPGPFFAPSWRRSHHPRGAPGPQPAVRPDGGAGFGRTRFSAGRGRFRRRAGAEGERVAARGARVMLEGQEVANNAARSAADSGRAAATIWVPATGR